MSLLNTKVITAQDSTSSIDMRGGVEAAGDFLHQARHKKNPRGLKQVKAGGEVNGHIVLGQELEGELHVLGNYSDGKLTYKRVIK